MINRIKANVACLTIALMLTATFALSASARPHPRFFMNPYYGNSYFTPYNPYYGGYYSSVFNRHPILSGAAVGGAVGALGGATFGVLAPGRHSIGKDALIGASGGAVLGAGVGMIRGRRNYGYW